MNNPTSSEIVESAEFIATGIASYSAEVLAEITGTDLEAVLFYQEQGLIKPCESDTSGGAGYDATALRTLRRLEMVKESCGMNVQGLKLLQTLMEEVERLRAELHRAHTS